MKNIALIAMAAFIAIYTLFGGADAIDIGITEVPIDTAKIGGPALAAILAAVYQFFPGLKRILKSVLPQKDPLNAINELELKVGQCPRCRQHLNALRQTLLEQRFSE